MGTIYRTPSQVPVPPFNHKTYREDQAKYLADLKAFCKKNSKSKEAGEIISFPVADGKAMYMVFKLSPVQLIHIDLLDGYSFPMIHRMTAKDIREEIERNKAIEKIFSDARKEQGK